MRPRRAPRWVFAGAAATLALALIGSVYNSPRGPANARLTFKQGELYDADPVTEEDAAQRSDETPYRSRAFFCGRPFRTVQRTPA